jgi:predicted GNAT family acetyltransferase
LENLLNVHRVDDASQFYDHVRAYLCENEIAHILHLGVLNTWSQVGTPSAIPYLGYAEQDGRIAGILIRSAGFRATVSQFAEIAGIKALAVDLLTYLGEESLPGIVGTQAESRAFVEVWRELTGCEFKLNRNERIYRLTSVIPVTNVSGEYRAATMDDLQLMTDWLMAFELEADHSIDPQDQDRTSYERGVLMRLESDVMLRGLRVWVDDGVIVSMAGYAGPTPNGIRIGPVYTPPEYRGHGYASAVTAALTQELLDQGRRFVALFTDLANPTSNSIYQKIGYQPICDVDEYISAAV